MSVSYTHLDVYKRQSLNNDINIGDIVVSTDLVHHDVDAGAFGYKKGQVPDMDVFSFGSDDAPVSYTHLDVYKRQL